MPRSSPSAFRLALETLAVVGVVLAVLAASLVGLVMQPIPFTSAHRGAAAPVDKARLEAHVVALSQTYHPRSHEFPDTLDRAAHYILHALEDAGARVRQQEYEWGPDRYRNVIGSFGPESGPRLVVGAHYDAVEDSPGADDNASGVAALLELGRLLGAKPPAARVDLVAYTLEEPPCFRTEHMGSLHHAESLRSEGVELLGMLSLESIGYYRDTEGSQDYPVALLQYFYPSKGDFIAVVGSTGDIGLLRRVKGAMKTASDLPVYSINAPSFVTGVDFSDHRSYWAFGYRAVMVTDTAFYRNANYHEPTDTADTLDYGRLSKVVQGVDRALREITRSP